MQFTPSKEPSSILPAWSASWIRNLERVERWCEAVDVCLDLDDETYELMKHREAIRITDEKARTLIEQFGANLGCLLQWIELASLRLHDDVSIPKECALPVIALSDEARREWTRHVQSAREQGARVREEVGAYRRLLEDSRSSFVNVDSEEYSSYSDYSTETSESSVDDEESSRDASRRASRARRKTRRSSSSCSHSEEDEEDEDEESVSEASESPRLRARSATPRRRRQAKG